MCFVFGRDAINRICTVWGGVFLVLETGLKPVCTLFVWNSGGIFGSVMIQFMQKMFGERNG